MPFGDQTFPAFNTQDAETTAVVQDGDTLVIGGLIGEQKTKSRAGIPYLMDLPVFGRFFGTTSDSSRRTELIILLKPSVIRNRAESWQVTNDFKSKLDSVKAELERMARDRKAHERKLKPQDQSAPAEHMHENPPSPPPAPVLAPGESMPAPPPPPLPLPEPSAAIIPQAFYAAMAPAIQPSESRVEVKGDPPVVAIAKPVARVNAVQPMPQQPAKALSLIAPPESVVSKKPPRPGAAPRSVEAISGWAVQVASFSTNKAAEMLATKLLAQGFDAYVKSGIYEQKTWHRVRIGRLGAFKEAVQLKDSIVANKPFKDAFVLVQ